MSSTYNVYLTNDLCVLYFSALASAHHIVSLSTVLDIKERRTLNLIVAPVVYCHCRRQTGEVRYSSVLCLISKSRGFDFSPHAIGTESLETFPYCEQTSSSICDSQISVAHRYS